MFRFSFIQKAMVLIGVFGLFGCATTKNPWPEAVEPASGSPESIGFYSAGCLRGGVSLLPDGNGYRVMRLSRRKFYGHPNLISFIEKLGEASSKKGWGPIVVGDLGQARGGPSMSGHLSHQNGLDVDIWYWQPPDPVGLISLDQRENFGAQSLVLSGTDEVDPARWSSQMSELLKLVADSPGVERVFVNPVIKRQLCKEDSGRAWLSKVRPWWGHDDHFHVRLRCPQRGSPGCVVQPPVPASDGCGAEFERAWFSAQAKAAIPKASSEARKMPVLPAACQAVLDDK